MGIINDIFPDITLRESKNDVLIDAIKQTMIKNNHYPSDSALLKVVQLYEIKNCRRSVIMIGNSGAAKSTTWKTLRDTLNFLKKEQINTFETVVVSNIKSIKQFYNQYNKFSI